MRIGSFFKLVEIQTKVASVIPFILGTVFVLYKFDNFNLKTVALFFVGMLIFDMTTTAINNYVDYKKAIKKEGFGYETHNAITRDGLNLNTVLKVIIGMLIISSILGIALVLNTDIIVLGVGVLCFGIGIFYSFGPVPISRTPFGEVFSGITMGFLITFLAIYINIYDTGIIGINIAKGIFEVNLNIKVLIEIFIISIPAIAGIANIMLANNICDMEEDIVNKRYTLPIFIGKEKSLTLFKCIYYIGFLAIIFGVITKILPITCILALIAFKLVNDNIKSFYKLQSKKDTFILAVKNFMISNVIYIVTLGIGCIIF